MGLALLVLSGQRGLRLPLPASEAELPPRWSALLVAYVIGTLHFAAATTLKASLPLFAREHVDLTLGGELPRSLAGTLLQGSEVIFQTLLAPIVLLGLSFLRRRRVELSVVAMIGIGMVLVVLPCLLMIRAALLADQGSPVSMLWVLGAHLAVALPNLLLTPMMLVLISQLVPRRHLSTAFALWFAVHVVSTKAANALMASKFELGQPLWYGGLGAMALLATGLWISQVRRIEAARRSC
jgi:dipeptide/tripeptide permease